MDAIALVEAANAFVHDGGPTLWDACAGDLRWRLVGGHNEATGRDEGVLLLLDAQAEKVAQKALEAFEARGEDEDSVVATIFLGGASQGLGLDQRLSLFLRTETRVVRAEQEVQVGDVHMRLVVAAMAQGSGHAPVQFGEDLLQAASAFLASFED